MKAAFKTGSKKFVFFNVLSIETEAAYAVGDLGLPMQAHGPEVEHLEVTVVVPGRQHPVRVGVGVAERGGPTITS